MRKSTALPDMNTTRDVTSPLNSVPGPGHRLPPPTPPKSILAASNSTFRLVVSKINFAKIINLFETINWPKKKRYENFVSVALSYGTLRQGIDPLFLIAFCCSSGTTPSSCPGFLCDRNLCLPFSKKCNGIQDCRDGSDETKCSEYLFEFLKCCRIL